MFDLTGKTALVTGAGQGVGRGIAAVLAKAGAMVIVNDIDGAKARTVAEALSSGDHRAWPAVFDVTDYDAVVAGIAGVADKTGPVDILVNNAGNAGSAVMQQRPFRETEPGEWRRFIDINLYAVLNCTKAVVDGMCERGFGRIVTVSSDAGRVGLAIGVSLYGAGKAAGAHFMRHLAVELGSTGVTANVVSLGLMNNVPDEFAGRVIRTIPAGRLGDPVDIGHAVAYLASDEAAWVTGATLAVNGGSLPL